MFTLQFAGRWYIQDRLVFDPSMRYDVTLKWNMLSNFCFNVTYTNTTEREADISTRLVNGFQGANEFFVTEMSHVESHQYLEENGTLRTEILGRILTLFAKF